MGCRHIHRVTPEKFIGVLRSPFVVGIVLVGTVQKPLLFNPVDYLSIGEEVRQIGIGQRVVVGQWNFVEVVRIDKLFMGGVRRTTASAHAIIILMAEDNFTLFAANHILSSGSRPPSEKDDFN
jgi:hypothetical protein